MKEAVAELAAELAELDVVLAGLTEDQWRTPSLAAGWDIRDQVSHLADTNEICFDTVTGGPRNLNEEAMSFPTPDDFTEAGCNKGRSKTGTEVLTWWRESAATMRDALEACDPGKRVPWGLGMSARMMATARLMEHWAHAYDIRGGLGMGPTVTPRLRSIAFLTLRAVPYALSLAKVSQPPGTLRAELTYDGETWRLGPDDADNLITGEALEFCLLGIRRLKRAETTTLKAHGALADAALDNLRAFL